MKKALTIGELLVTMAIIGIIATLVLPGFIQDYHKKIYVTKLKKMTEMIEAAVTQACTDNDVSYFYQTPYAAPLDFAKQKSFIEKYFKVSGSNSITQSYKAIRGGETASYTFSNSLAGGEYIIMKCWDNKTTCDFIVDINGKGGPNVGGRDIHIITLGVNDNGLTGPYPDKCGGELRGASESEEAYISRMNASTTYNATGNGCFAHILYDNWEMKY
jgi:type II secretory pathway pseudopilin PulG